MERARRCTVQFVLTAARNARFHFNHTWIGNHQERRKRRKRSPRKKPIVGTKEGIEGRAKRLG